MLYDNYTKRFGTTGPTGVTGEDSFDIDDLGGIEYGRWQIVSNQMIFYREDNSTEIARFDLKDAAGNPAMTNVFERTKV